MAPISKNTDKICCMIKNDMNIHLSSETTCAGPSPYQAPMISYNPVALGKMFFYEDNTWEANELL